MNDLFLSTKNEVLELLNSPLEELVQKAQSVHEKYADKDIQKCELLSIKTGGCAEDCAYCSQSAHYKTCVKVEPLLPLSVVIEKAKEAKANGATRFCMGGAWKYIPRGKDFNRLLEMVFFIASIGLEPCATFGTPTKEQLIALKNAGLISYNHNIDTSRNFYPRIVTTRSYDDRLKNIFLIKEVGIKLCCGVIIGLGENIEDRAAFLVELSRVKPDGVPINMLIPIAGTPLENAKAVLFDDFLRVVTVARILLPKSRITLGAGRHLLSEEEQLKCFRVGANSIFIGEKLLTTDNVSREKDKILLSNFIT